MWFHPLRANVSVEIPRSLICFMIAMIPQWAEVILKKNWIRSMRDITRLLKDYTWTFHWIRNLIRFMNTSKMVQAWIMRHPEENIWMVSLWQIILDLNLSMRQKWSFLMKTENLIPRRPIIFWVCGWRRQTVQSFPVFMVLCQTERLRHFPEVDPILPDLLLHVQWKQICMRTGPMYQDSL